MVDGRRVGVWFLGCVMFSAEFMCAGVGMSGLCVSEDELPKVLVGWL